MYPDQKYRVWDPNREQMLELLRVDFDTAITSASHDCYFKVNVTLVTVTGEDPEIEDEEQFNNLVWLRPTGMQDKNDNPIYESDIIKLSEEARKAFDAVGSDGSGVTKHAVVGFHHGAWMYGRNPGHPEHYNSYLWMVAQLDYGSSLTCEVVGNVYEHPHLLKEDQ